MYMSTSSTNHWKALILECHYWNAGPNAILYKQPLEGAAVAIPMIMLQMFLLSHSIVSSAASCHTTIDKSFILGNIVQSSKYQFYRVPGKR